MKITKSFLQGIIKEEIKNIFGDITFDIDKTFMYSSGDMPYVEININFPNVQTAHRLLSQIQKNYKRISWKISDNQIYGQILFHKTPFAQREHEYNFKLKKIKNALSPLGIKLGKIINPPPDDPDAPTKPDIKIVN